METTTKETTSTNLPRRHHLKTRHLTVNTPPTDVTLVKKHGNFFFLYINEITLGCVE